MIRKVRAATFLAALGLWAPALSASAAPPQSLGPHEPCESSALAVDAAGAVLLADNEVHKVLYRLGRDGGHWRVVGEVPMPTPKKHRPKDIEALAALPDGLVVIGSHGRKSDCDASKSRRRIRFLRGTDGGWEEARFLDSADHLDTALASEEACLKGLFARPGELAAGFCSAVVAPRERGVCRNDLNIEGAFVDPDGRLWLGFRWPMIGGRAVLGRLAENAEVLRLDGLVSFDLGGRSVRELTLSGDRVYGLAGPARDSDAEFALWSAPFPFGDAPVARVIADDLPGSSEGLAILGERALVVTDGKEPDRGERCEETSRYFERPLP